MQELTEIATLTTENLVRIRQIESAIDKMHVLPISNNYGINAAERKVLMSMIKPIRERMESILEFEIPKQNE